MAEKIKWGIFTPSQRHLNPEMGGGSLLDVGVYAISFASMIFQKSPQDVFGFGHIGEIGSDEQGAALLKNELGEIADLSFVLRTKAVNDAYIFGTEGYIKIDEVFAVPTKASLVIQDKVTEVMRCLKKGLKESPFMPLEESLQIMRIMDQIRAPWDLTYSND